MTGALGAVLDAWAAAESCAVRVRGPEGLTQAAGAPAAAWRTVPLGGDEGWMLEVDAAATVPPPRLEALAVSVAALIAADEELAAAARELTERYEEIDLLYRVGDLLGATVRIEDAAGTMLRELAETIGARRAALYVAPDEAAPPVVLERLAAIGAVPPAEDRVDALDPVHPAAAAFRDCLSLLRDGREGPSTTLAVPLLRVGGDSVIAPIGSGMTGDRVVAPGGGLLGAIVLEAPRHGGAFTAGDRKLAAAVATQVATALHNARLVERALAQQRLEQELRLAHDLQLALLSDPRLVGPEADAAARVIPAERVGGDFYLLKRLDAARTAVLVGDVAGHGYRAALMMAAAVATAAAHAERAAEPAEWLGQVERSLRDELEGTELSLSLCCAVLDAARGELRFANAGHPHAFVLRRGDASPRRLAAMVPPLGIAAGPPASASLPFDVSDDLLVIFTDGAVDARDAAGRRVGEARVLAAMARAHGAGGDAAAVVAALVAEVDAHRGAQPLRDDLAAVAVRRVAAP